jgi:lipopolysaccharide export system protein LptA
LVKFGDNNQAESIHGLGNVMIIQDDKRARAAKAEYDVLAGKVTLSGGSPMALTGDGSIMTADTMHFWRNTGLFKGDKARIVPAGELDVPGLFPEPGR